MPKIKKTHNCSMCKKGNFRTKFDLKQHERTCKHKVIAHKVKTNNTPIDRDTDAYCISKHIDRNGKNYNSVHLKSCRIKKYVSCSSEPMTFAYMYIGGRTVKVLVRVLEDGMVLQPYELVNKWEFERFFRLPSSCKDQKLKLREYALKVY